MPTRRIRQSTSSAARTRTTASARSAAASSSSSVPRGSRASSSPAAGSPRATRSRSRGLLDLDGAGVNLNESSAVEDTGSGNPVVRSIQENIDLSCVDLTEDSPPPTPTANESIRETVVIDLTSSEPPAPKTRRTDRGGVGKGQASSTAEEDVPGPSASLLVSPIGSEKDFSCPICLDSRNRIRDSDRKLASTMCGHVFCNRCLMEAWQFQKKCPICRVKVLKSHIHMLHNL